MTNNTISPAQAFEITSLINATEQSIASRILAKTTGGQFNALCF